MACQMGWKLLLTKLNVKISSEISGWYIVKAIECNIEKNKSRLFSFLYFAAELGDYDPRRHLPGYASEFNIIANQTQELENKASEIHKGLW